MTELTATPNDCALPRIRADFATFNDAIDYAARSAKGMNFHDMRGELELVYPYAQMRADALDMAYRLVASGITKGDRVALIAETGPDFSALFCACTLVGAWPAAAQSRNEPMPGDFVVIDGRVEHGRQILGRRAGPGIGDWGCGVHRLTYCPNMTRSSHTGRRCLPRSPDREESIACQDRGVDGRPRANALGHRTLPANIRA